MTNDTERAAENDAVMIEDYAAFWWARESGETDEWEDLDADEREAVVENSYAETVIDWLASRTPSSTGADQ